MADARAERRKVMDLQWDIVRGLVADPWGDQPSFVVLADKQGHCDCCEQLRPLRDGVCRDCEHPDDTEFWGYDPGEEF